jgi:hypothetical protein
MLPRSLTCEGKHHLHKRPAIVLYCRHDLAAAGLQLVPALPGYWFDNTAHNHLKSSTALSHSNTHQSFAARLLLQGP